jgi:hypothetical protein
VRSKYQDFEGAGGGGLDVGGVPTTWDLRRDLLHLWTAPRWQEGWGSVLTKIDCNIYPTSPTARAQMGSPLTLSSTLVNLESHYKRQGLSVPVRSVSPFFRSFKQPWLNLQAAARYGSPLVSTA